MCQWCIKRESWGYLCGWGLAIPPKVYCLPWLDHILNEIISHHNPTRSITNSDLNMAALFFPFDVIKGMVGKSKMPSSVITALVSIGCSALQQRTHWPPCAWSVCLLSNIKLLGLCLWQHSILSATTTWWQKYYLVYLGAITKVISLNTCVFSPLTISSAPFPGVLELFPPLLCVKYQGYFHLSEKGFWHG